MAAQSGAPGAKIWVHQEQQTSKGFGFDSMKACGTCITYHTVPVDSVEVHL